MNIGLLTGGGDSPAINGAIRAVVRRAHSTGHQVTGFREGLQGQTLQGEQGFRAMNRAQQMIDAGASPADIASLSQNPEFNPAGAAQINEEALDREAAMTAAQKAEATRIGGLRAGLDSIGQDIGAVQDMRTLYQTVGSETLPTAASGAFQGIRLRLLNSLRQATESGALQQAEIELFNEILPEGKEWTSMGRAEKMARLNQLEYWFGQRLDNAITASGEDFDRSEFTRFGRDYDSILGPVPAGTEEGLGEGTGGGIMAPLTDAPGLAQPTIPGTNIPIASPLGVR